MGSDNPAWYELKITKDMTGVMGGKALRGVVGNFFSSRIYTGKVAVLQVSKYLEAALAPEERRALIVTDSFTRRYSKKITEQLDVIGMESRVWDGAEPDAPLHTIDAGVAVCEEFRPAAVFALGGGSVIDTVKMLMFRYEKPGQNPRMVLPFSSLGLRKKVKYFIAVPTTSGTGSEVTPVAVVTDTSVTPHKKLEIFSDEFFSDMTILDTDFVKDMPPGITAATGLDALAHAVGSYVSNWGGAYIDAMNSAAIKEIIKYLPRAREYGGKDLEARAHMQMASLMAGIGFGNTTAGIDHSMGHSMGTIFGVHHGLAVAAFLTCSISYQAKITDRWVDLCPLFGAADRGRPREELLAGLLGAVRDFITSLGCAACVSELDKPAIDRAGYDEHLETMAEYADNDAVSLTSYRPVDKNIYRRLFEYAWDGRIVDF
jgi:alcohol dehydrogenase class IV